MSRPTAAMRREAIRRAGGRCEYCLILEEDSASRHQVDHVLAEKHGGQTVPDNLALSCLPCNRRKGSDIGAVDPQTGRFVRLFDPRRQLWRQHFRLTGSRIIGVIGGTGWALSRLWDMERTTIANQQKSLFEQLVAIPRLKGAVVVILVTAVITAAFLIWLAYQWHHGPAP